VYRVGHRQTGRQTAITAERGILSLFCTVKNSNNRVDSYNKLFYYVIYT